MSDVRSFDRVAKRYDETRGGIERGRHYAAERLPLFANVVCDGRLVSGTLAARAILRKLLGGRLAVAVGLHRVYPLKVRYRWALGRFSPERLARVTCGERREPSRIAVE